MGVAAPKTTDVIIFFPSKNPYSELAFDHHRLPHAPGKNLRHYLRSVHLIGLRMHSRCTLDGSPRPLRMNYVPAPGDRIVLARQR